MLYDADTDATLWQGHRFVGLRATNNVAEYEGLLLGLQAVVCHFANSAQMTVQGDSHLVLNQMMRRWPVKADHLKPLCARAQGLLQALPYTPTYHWVPRASNSTADALANKAMDTRTDWEALAQPQAGPEA